MKLLITGGAGYIGSVVAARLIEAGNQISVLDDESTGHRDAVPAGAAFLSGRVHEAMRMLDPSYDGVLHFAARSLVAESVLHPELYWANNVVGSLALLDAMRQHNVPRIVFSSTAATYGVADTMPITEDTPARPINAYGQSKLAVDHALDGYARAHGIAAVSVRYFNVAGGYGHLGERHQPETHLIPNVLAVAAGRAENVSVFGTDYPTRDGTAIRDFLHVIDLADAHLAALVGAEAGQHRIYNLGSGTGYSVREVIDAARAVTGHNIPVIERERRPGDPPVLIAGNHRIAKELGWRPTRGLIEMITDAWAILAFHRLQ